MSMKKELLNIRLNVIFEHYTQNELAKILLCGQWELLNKMLYNSFTKGDIRKINKLYKDTIIKK